MDKKNTSNKRLQGFLNLLHFVFIGLNSDLCLLGFPCKTEGSSLAFFKVKMKYIINSHCFWLELCQCFKLMLKYLMLLQALTESSSWGTATKTSYRPPSSFASRLVTINFSPFTSIRFFKRSFNKLY